MGDMTEHLEHLHSDAIGSEHIWTTRTGEEIPMRQLGDVHLENIILMIRRSEARTSKFRNEQILEAHSFLASCNGEAARDAVEQSIKSYDTASVDDILKEAYPPYKHLLEEKERRKNERSNPK